MNSIKKLFNIEVPIIQGGMVWCSGWRLASAVSNAGGLGLIGAGSMYPEVLREHIQKCRIATSKPFGVNVPLLYPDIEKIMEIIVEEKVEIVFSSAGNPALWTPFLKENNISVVHVIANRKFAEKAEQSGVDAIVAEGFEAGGHNGREETTTLCLVPEICDAVSIPVIAAGGIGSGKAMLAAFALGAEGVQAGSLFAASIESSAHPEFKQAIVQAAEGDTKLSMKSLMPVRLLKNDFYLQVAKAEAEGASRAELIILLGKGRAKKGMFEGDLTEGELEIGQVASYVHDIKPAAQILTEMWQEFILEKERISKLKF
ncbi:enoyl-[acyl-carrier protein] reductase II [Daejeonella rubra]|uniref:Enoyl-[acyl-carrier protein] reductase II n=1 Tax=Daejeonella rubra TaxID=990371 RepID=A0A1G9NZ73_9SPHI|nr:nitronate monooxygenase [Daejeonella rubra]SDL91275.1 enoyl-[acyl-carrier protein] reductase II [Daejeonella rubra]